MEKTWTYNAYQIQEGLKPGSSQFRYFFTVSRSGDKKCHFCVWIVDDALSLFDPNKDFDAIISSQIETWHKWVKEKIDAKDFSNRALKFDKTGKREINLSEMTKHIRMDS
jgi:hypothetical protein